MSVIKFGTGGYEIDSTPELQPDGKYRAHARVTRQSDHQVEEIWPDFKPFLTEAEASSAAHLAAVAWVAHQSDQDS
jgi:hypothetical protein